MRIITSVFMSLLLFLAWGCEHHDNNITSTTNEMGNAVVETAGYQDAAMNDGVSVSNPASVRKQYSTNQPQGGLVGVSDEGFILENWQITNAFEYVSDDFPVTNSTPSVTTNGMGTPTP